MTEQQEELDNKLESLRITIRKELADILKYSGNKICHRQVVVIAQEIMKIDKFKEQIQNKKIKIQLAHVTGHSMVLVSLEHLPGYILINPGNSDIFGKQASLTLINETDDIITIAKEKAPTFGSKIILSIPLLSSEEASGAEAHTDVDTRNNEFYD